MPLFAGGERRVAEGAPSAVGHDASRWKMLANVGMPADGQFKQLVAVPPNRHTSAVATETPWCLSRSRQPTRKGASVEIPVLMMAI